MASNSSKHPESYYEKWDQLYERERRLFREMHAAPSDAAKSNTWQRAAERLTAHECSF